MKPRGASRLPPRTFPRREKLPRRILREMRRYPSFYQQVWRACAAIPPGEVRTYSWIARRIGNPHAARAVGQALAKNPFSPHVPCHRVIGADGSLTGFSGPGGLGAKRKILNRERRKDVTKS